MKYKPYPAYRDSGVEWAQRTPSHWTVSPLMAIADERDRPNKGMQENNLLSLSYGEIVTKDINDNDGLLPESFETYQIIEADDIVWRLTDLQNDKRSLRTALATQRGIITSAYLATRIRAANARFVAYQLRSYDTTKVFYSMGGGLRQSMKYSDVKRLPMILPPAAEQTAIATFLDRETAKLDTLIAKQEKLVELLQEKRQALISHAVTKGLHPDAPMKDSSVEWIRETPSHWDVRRVKTVSTFTTSGPRGWSERVGEMGNLFIQSGDLNDSLQIEFESAKRVQVENDAEALRTQLREGDVVVCITGAKTGNVAVSNKVPEKAYVNQHLCLIRPGNEVTPAFLGLSLKSKAGQTFFDLSQYGLKQGLSLENVRDAIVLVPPLPEQVAIVNHLDCETKKLDTLIEKSRRSIDLMREHRTALISAAVTGKIDVREAA